MAYTKKLVTASFSIYGSENPVAVADTESTNYGTGALAQFLAGETVKLVTVEGEEETILYVPFHAIVAVEVSYETATIDSPENANCNYEGC